jgi:small subunit ribosomal protein S1
MEINVNSIVKGTIMFVNREARTATVNVNHMVPAVLTQDMLTGSAGEQQSTFRKLQQDAEIEVVIVSIPDEANANGMIIVRQYDPETEARNATLAKLTDGTIVTAAVTEVNGNGATISVEGVKIYVPASEINGRQAKLRSIRPGDKLSVQITGRKQDQRRGLSIYGSQRLASDTARKQKQEVSIVTLQKASTNHTAFKRPIKAVTEFGVFIHLMNGIDGLLGLAQMDQATRRLFVKKQLVAGAEITVQIESMRQNGEEWRLRLSQKQEEQASETARKQKLQATIATLQEASDDHMIFERTVKAVAAFGVFVHLMNGVDGLLGVAQMDDKTRELFDNKQLVAGAAIDVEIESMQLKDRNWRLRLNQKLIPVRYLHDQINSEETAREGVVRKLRGQPNQDGKRGAVGLGQAIVAAIPQHQEVIVEIDGMFGVLSNNEISAADWTGHFYKVGAKIKVYSAAVDTRRSQLQLKAAKL